MNNTFTHEARAIRNSIPIEKQKLLLSLKCILICSILLIPSISVAWSNQYTNEGIITHLVVCWLKSDINNEGINRIIDETKKLASIPGVIDLEIGEAIESEREIVDDSFTFTISMKFRSKEEMDTYLIHEDHISYVKNVLKPKLSKIIVYDFKN